MNKDITLEDLGYRLDKQNNYLVYYKLLKLGREIQIEFNFDYKTIEKRKCWSIEAEQITLKQLQAIYNKCKELGWLDE